MTVASDNAALRRQIADLQGKIVKQRQEVARLTADNEKLRADKAGLRFDLEKAKKRADQLAAIVHGGIA